MPSYRGYRFPPNIISHAVWVYHRFSLSFREVEDLLAERGIIVTYETIRQWCATFGLEYDRRLRCLARGDLRLKLKNGSSPHRGRSLPVQRQLDNAGLDVRLRASGHCALLVRVR